MEAFKSKSVVQFEGMVSSSMINTREGDLRVALLSSGEVFVWGRSFCVSPGEIGTIAVPAMVSMLYSIPIHQIAVGNQYVIALSSTGQAYWWGHLLEPKSHMSSEVSPRALTVMPHMPGSKFNAIETSPTLVPLQQDPITYVAAAASHAVFVTAYGDYYFYGYDYASFDMKVVLQPELRSLKERRVVQAACGQYHTLLLDDEAIVHAWGNSSFGQCTDHLSKLIM